MLQKLGHEPREKERDRPVSCDGQKQVNVHMYYNYATYAYMQTKQYKVIVQQ